MYDPTINELGKKEKAEILLNDIINYSFTKGFGTAMFVAGFTWLMADFIHDGIVDHYLIEGGIMVLGFAGIQLNRGPYKLGKKYISSIDNIVENARRQPLDRQYFDPKKR